MKLLRSKLTYANVISTFCLFLLLGGGAAVAANKLGKNSVGTSQLKKNAITSAKIKNGAVTSAKIQNGAVTSAQIQSGAITAAQIQNGAITGSKVNLGSLGTVPSATHATSAVTAGNSNTVNGQSLQKVFALVPDGTVGQQTIATFAGFTLTSNCAASNPDLNLVSPAGIAVDMKFQGNGAGVDPGPVSGSAQGSGSQTLNLDRDGASNNDRGESSFSAALINGTVVSGEIGFEDSLSFAATTSCAIFGHVAIG
jgi:hypothetical protein